MNEILSEDEQDRDAHRSIILTLGGFSFTGLVGLIVVETALRQDYKMAIYNLLVSFMCLLLSLNVQGYKSKRWHDQIATGIMDAGTLSLVIAAAYLIWQQHYSLDYSFPLILISLIAWLIDHIIRLSIQWRYLSLKGGRSR